jgi:F0F1-type ATP synthase assembly protein I
MGLLSRKDKIAQAERRKANGALGFGTSFAAGMAVFSLGGHWLDVKFDKEPLFTLAGVSLGFVFGGWELWKLVAAANKRIAEEDRLAAQKQEVADNEADQ